jgi:hypothetical protein
VGAGHAPAKPFPKYSTARSSWSTAHLHRAAQFETVRRRIDTPVLKGQEVWNDDVSGHPRQGTMCAHAGKPRFCVRRALPVGIGRRASGGHGTGNGTRRFAA